MVRAVRGLLSDLVEVAAAMQLIRMLPIERFPPGASVPKWKGWEARGVAEPELVAGLSPRSQLCVCQLWVSKGWPALSVARC
jgi:hypothetical protein